MVSAGEFRNGITFEEDGNVYQIVEFQHVNLERAQPLSAQKSATSLLVLWLKNV